MAEAQPIEGTEPIEETVTPEGMAERLSAGAQVVDVRTAGEYAEGHVREARHITIDRLSEEAAALDRDRPVIFYCRSGDRSATAAEAFRASGWEAYSLEGGLVAWDAQGQPLEPEGGHVAEGTNLPPS